jgi:TPR repeat protein
VGVNKYQSALSPDLRALYRRVAKRVHPDFATDEGDRHRREGFMKEANAAYRKHDPGTLGKILKEYETSPESSQDTPFVPADGDGWHQYGLRFWGVRNYREAVRCFERGLELAPNHASLHFYLGLAYYQGLGVPKADYKRAMDCWRKAAQQGNAEAQNNLGQVYESGNGIEQDYSQAAHWYRKAAARGHVTSLFNLGVMYELGHGVPQDLVQAAALYQRAADRGYAPAQFNLGIMYELGEGVPQDYEQAAIWYREAVECGLDEAREALWRVLRKIPNGDHRGQGPGE